MGVGVAVTTWLRLTLGILAVQSTRAPVAPSAAARYASAAADAGAAAGVDPFLLVGIARNESDFRPRVRGPDGKDCGLTQTRVTYSRYSCRELMRDPRLAFGEAARELAENGRACRGRVDHERCVINRYNSGVRYARRGGAGRYWLRVLCFAEAARAGRPPSGDCRAVRSRRHLLEVARGRAAADPPRARQPW